MTVSLTYDTSLSRVRINATGLTGAATADVERSEDAITWTLVRGGIDVPVTAATLATVDDYEFIPDVVNHYRVTPNTGSAQTGTTTPTLDTVWLKNLARPFLNRPVTVTDWSDVERPARNGVFDIIGRTMPVAVTDLRSSRRYELVLTTATVAEADEIDLCLASGDPILLHVPADCVVPGMYAVVGDVNVSRREPRSTRRYLSLPLVECAAPGPDVVGATNTWGAVIATYATWADLIADNATWQDVLDGVADPDDVVVD